MGSPASNTRSNHHEAMCVTPKTYLSSEFSDYSELCCIL